MVMADRQTIEARLRQKEREIQILEFRLREANGYARALRELLGLGPYGEKSMVDQARDIISERGHPVHIVELLKAMGREVSRENRVSLTSALSAYVRKGEIFRKFGPNEFGLRDHKPNKSRKLSLSTKPRAEPPDDFGQMAIPPPKTDETSGGDA
ncbi:hypothetical protein [Hyphomicrobium denitrificans]|uniref:hypothetical protein n=1 Tax=Hyphomicrobium denitrificans TaxID=53399 RepID=UPI0012327408|nr:hypothetical protein [Hyphomicrobium denitrificans]